MKRTTNFDFKNSLINFGNFIRENNYGNLINNENNVLKIVDEYLKEDTDYFIYAMEKEYSISIMEIVLRRYITPNIIRTNGVCFKMKGIIKDERHINEINENFLKELNENSKISERTCIISNNYCYIIINKIEPILYNLKIWDKNDLI